MPTPTPSKFTGLSNVSISPRLSTLQSWGYDPPSIFSFVSVPIAPDRLTDISSFENRILFTLEKGKHHFMHGVYTIRNYNEYLIGNIGNQLSGRHTASLFEFFYCFDQAGFLGVSPPDGQIDQLLDILSQWGPNNNQIETPSSLFGFDFIESSNNNSLNILIPQTNSDGNFDIVITQIRTSSTIKGRITLI